MPNGNIILRGIAGLAIARSTDPPLEGSQAAGVTAIPLFLGGLLGGLFSLVIAKVVADQLAESLRPVIAVEPPDHDYGDDIAVGTPVSQTFVVSNTGTAELEVTETSLDSTTDFVIDSGGVIGGTPLKLAPGATHNITVTFTPTITGEQKGDLLIFSNDPDQPIFKIPLEGTGVAVAPAIKVDPDPLPFGDVPINFAVSKILDVSNTGTADLIVNQTTLNDPNQFTIARGGAGGGVVVTVPPGETRFVEVGFKPQLPDGEKTARLEIISNDPDPARSTRNVTLTGKGFSLPSPGLKKP